VLRIRLETRRIREFSVFVGEGEDVANVRPVDGRRRSESRPVELQCRMDGWMRELTDLLQWSQLDRLPRDDIQRQLHQNVQPRLRRRNRRRVPRRALRAHSPQSQRPSRRLHARVQRAPGVRPVEAKRRPLRLLYRHQRRRELMVAQQRYAVRRHLRCVCGAARQPVCRWRAELAVSERAACRARAADA
jgi:hypothetical protein